VGLSIRGHNRLQSRKETIHTQFTARHLYKRGTLLWRDIQAVRHQFSDLRGRASLATFDLS
jgi:hypothetical protein